MCDAPPNGKRRTFLIRFFIVVLVIALAIFLYWLFWGRFYESTDDAYVGGNRVVLTPQVPGIVTHITSDDTDFVEALVRGVLKEQAGIDEKIQPIAPDWPIDQIARIDRNILRIGVYELLNEAKVVPPKVAINESVELAKAFGSDNSSKFVNGVLGTAYRTLIEGATDGSTTV